jgi:hypothetical protein
MYVYSSTHTPLAVLLLCFALCRFTLLVGYGFEHSHAIPLCFALLHSSSPAFALYGMMTNIQWLHPEDGASAADGKLRGTATNKELGQLRNFALDTTRHSDQWIADHLWSMVSPVA